MICAPGPDTMTHPGTDDLTALWNVIGRLRERLREGTLDAADLEALEARLLAFAGRPRRQRLLYLHAREPSVTSEVIGWAQHPGSNAGAEAGERPYATVLAAIEDGWQAIHFPQQMGPVDDRETDLVGFEFILQRLEAVRD
jgi:hypothetical protein